MIITNVRPWGTDAVDLLIENGRIAASTPHVSIPAAQTTAPADRDVVDGRGRLVVPSFSDVHVHLDSTRIGLPFRPHTGAPGVWGMMLNDRNNWRTAEIGIEKRVAGTLERMIARGTTRVRSYAQVDVDCKLQRFDAVMAAKQKFAGQADVQVMTFPQAGILREEGTVELLEESLKQGADVMGGIDPSQLDRDPARHLDIVFGLAEKYQVEIDIHLHEPGELGVFSTELVLERIRALGMQGKVTLSHAYDLGSVSEAVSRRLIEQFAELDVAMATVAPPATTQLSLLALTEAGVRVGLGEDGQRDYWSPYGNCDMLDRTWQLAFTNDFRRDEQIEHALAVATMGGASVMSPEAPRLRGILDRPGVSVGDRADLLLVDGETVTSAVMDRGNDRTVLHDGRVVAEGLHVVSA
ncbi:amidohydrolase [Glaciibacter psychrotolerans]|uniref:Cytosine/adenosine deaminase-related metal-dependent hydrolase n=1 Tax=Glaciibacter psychrotolerans TaxID=670054 RepID=A0A7Z0EFM5_9MICO|nr:amidohydrolase [Leifsonia psychrotolerans]NYJ20638.1 cytosine/adenosine deaminase-related metal-dependent hydrolase [Leifsonia psychrotolerans]